MMMTTTAPVAQLPEASAPAPGRRRHRNGPLPYLLMAPAFIVLAVVSIYPLVAGIQASTTKYLYGRPRGSAGLSNYIDVLHDQVFWQAMLTTLLFVVLAVTLETILGLGLALLVYREVRGVKFFRMSLIAPMTIAPVVVGVIWRLMYSSETGWVDPVFTTLGFGAPRVLSHENTAFFGLVIVDVWEWTPLLFLICLAGLQSIPQEPMEAAAVDGASQLRILFDHTLPLLLPVLAVGVVLRLIDCIGTFDQIFVLTRGGPGTATQLISIYAYNTSFNFTDYGRGTAMLLILLAFVLLLVGVAITLMRGASKRVS
jgi:multiple sugar transport system permease protein